MGKKRTNSAEKPNKIRQVKAGDLERTSSNKIRQTKLSGLQQTMKLGLAAVTVFGSCFAVITGYYDFITQSFGVAAIAFLLPLTLAMVVVSVFFVWRTMDKIADIHNKEK